MRKIEKTKKFLGEEYSIQEIDMEECIYRDLGNGFDIEVSGCNRHKKQTFGKVFVWRNKKQIVETINGGKNNTPEDLKNLLDSVVLRYEHERA